MTVKEKTAKLHLLLNVVLFSLDEISVLDINEKRIKHHAKELEQLIEKEIRTNITSIHKDGGDIATNHISKIELISNHLASCELSDISIIEDAIARFLRP